MNQRRLLAIAAALTAFVLLVVGAVATHVVQPVDTAQTVPVAQAPARDPSAEAAYQQRLADYKAALAEANHRLELANQQLADQAKAAASMATASVIGPSYAVSGEQAQSIALKAAPGSSLVKPAELVRYQGTPAYEVALDRGTVYIDAQSAAVLANSATVGQVAEGQVTAEQAAQIAIAYRGGGEVRAVKLEREHGGAVYAVIFVDGGEVYVAVANGQVVYAQLDRQDEGGQGDDGHDD